MKARAIQWLAQRDHSELELRRKLLAAERRSERLARASQDAPDGRGAPAVPGGQAGPREPVGCGDPGPAAAATTLQQRVDDTIAWLRRHDLLNDARFVESRVHARSRQFGVLRIRQELELHGAGLPEAMAADLRANEFQRADAMRRRRWGDDPAGVAEQARCARWLAQRGFSGETVARVVRAMRAGAAADEEPAAGDA